MEILLPKSVTAMLKFKKSLSWENSPCVFIVFVFVCGYLWSILRCILLSCGNAQEWERVFSFNAYESEYSKMDESGNIDEYGKISFSVKKPRKELKIRCVAEYFWAVAEYFYSRWNIFSIAWYTFSIKAKTKARFKRRTLYVPNLLPTWVDPNN